MTSKVELSDDTDELREFEDLDKKLLSLRWENKLRMVLSEVSNIVRLCTLCILKVYGKRPVFNA